MHYKYFDPLKLANKEFNDQNIMLACKCIKVGFYF